MRKLLALLLVFGLITGISGCPKPKDKKDKDSKKDVKDKEKADKEKADKDKADKDKTNKKTIKLSADALEIKAGAKKAEATVTVKRTGYEGDVKITVTKPDEDTGLTVAKEEYTVKADEDSVKIEVGAEKAKAGEQKITISGTGTGDDAKLKTNDIELIVKITKGTAASTDVGKFTIDAKAFEIAQGAKDIKATIKVKKDKYEGPVTVKIDAGEDSKIKFDKEEYTIPEDKDSVEVKATAEADAKVGEQEVKITATGKGGKPEASMTLKVKVKKKGG